MTGWRQLAACGELTKEERLYFFGDADDGTSAIAQHRVAQSYCFGCPVQLDCLAFAVRVDPPMGVWGGLTESQRKRYLWPVVRRRGSSPEVLIEVLAILADKIIPFTD